MVLVSKIPEDAYIVRATEVGQYLNCPRNWLFMSHNGFNLEPLVRPQKLRFGLVWHKGLEYLYSGKDPYAGIDEEIKKESDLIYDVGQYDLEINSAIEEERELAKNMMRGYMMWRNACEPPDDELKVLNTERRAVIPIPGVYAYLAVRFDAEVVYKGGVWVLEHKTRSKSTSVDFAPELQLDIQMGLQLLASSATNEIPVRGALYNLARKQASGPRVKAPLFGRHAVTRSKEELNRLSNTLRIAAISMMKDSALADVDPTEAMLSLPYNPQPTGICGWGCSVKEICEAINRGEDIDYLVKASFKPREKTIMETLADEILNN